MSALAMNIVGVGCERRVLVTSRSQLVVAPIEYNEVSFQSLAVNDQVYNFYKPRSKKQFVITGMVITGGFNLGNQLITVEFFEANSITSTVVDKVILTIFATKGNEASYSDLNLLINEGKFINGRSDDAEVGVNILGYYVAIPNIDQT